MNTIFLQSLVGFVRRIAGIALRGLRRCAALLLFHFALSVRAAEPAVTQVIELNAGWNLISLQVGSGLTPAQFQAALGPDSAKLRAIWSFGEATVSGSAPWQWRFHRTDAGQPNDLTQIQPGKGYWVDVSGYCQATITGTPWNGSVTIRPGWNLVGFPGVSLAANEQQELAALFGPSFPGITQVWAWDSGSAQRFTGYDITSIPQVKDLTAAQPGRGYWVYSIAPGTISLTPQPYVALPADSDASPPQAAEPFQATDPRWLGPNPARYAGKTVRFRATDASDTPYDINANGVLDDPYTQDTILFEKTADTVSITIGNNGSGAFAWALENTCDWIYTAPADDRTWPGGATTRPRDASGTVSSEKDVLLLYADRTGMTPGRKSGSITLWVGGTAFPISLLLDVADVTGDWRGFATTTRVGGRNITLGEVRLVLNSFTTNGTDESGGFRAVLNHEQSVLFPRDVFMDGVFYAANQFKLTTNFEMKAGDRNAPPYDVFPGNPNDRDFNNNGRVDAVNPFPFGIRREVTLLGTRVSPDRLEGTYIESIRGMMPPLSGNTLVTDLNQFVSDAFLTQSQPVFIEGTFVLERQSFAPSLRSVFNSSADPGLEIGGSDTTTRGVAFDVVTPATVQGVSLSLNLTFPDPALLQIRLLGPNPDDDPFLIHEFGDSSAIPTSVVIPANSFNGPANGIWTLVIEWDGTTGERGNLESWGLKIEGAATHQASGRLVKAGAMPLETIEGAAIRLEGGVTTLAFTSAADGTFTIPDLTENDYTLYIAKPGYPTTAVTFFVSEADVALGDLAITPLAISEPRLTALPPIGYAGTQPLHVDFTLDLPLNFGAATIAWDFDGNGTADRTGPIAALTETSYDYAVPGIYHATVTLSGGTLGAPVEKTQVIHAHRGVADPGGGSQQILVHSFVGAFGALTDPGAASPAASPVAVTEVQTQSVTWLGTPPAARSLTSGFVFQESIWDIASFDLDRMPRAPGTAFGGPEDLDLTPGWPSLRYVRFNTNSPNPTKYEALTYAQTPEGSRSVELNNPAGFTPYIIPGGRTTPNRFQIVTVLGGAVFSAAPSAVGDIRIHPGRTLP